MQFPFTSPLFASPLFGAPLARHPHFHILLYLFQGLSRVLRRAGPSFRARSKRASKAGQRKSRSLAGIACPETPQCISYPKYTTHPESNIVICISATASHKPEVAETPEAAQMDATLPRLAINGASRLAQHMWSTDFSARRREGGRTNGEKTKEQKKK